MERQIVVAIDGPAGAGKSTIARKVAQHFNIYYVDTGAMYRAIGLYMLDQHIDPLEETDVVGKLENIEMSLTHNGQEQEIMLNGQKMGERIRSQEVGQAASIISSYIAVREKMVGLQQALAKNMSLVMDGRDIGTHVLVDAPIKIYMTADSEIRGERRQEQLRRQGKDVALSIIVEEINQRDTMDKNRQASPLRQAEDAVYLDTSKLSIEQVVEKIIRLVEKKLEK